MTSGTSLSIEVKIEIVHKLKIYISDFKSFLRHDSLFNYTCITIVKLFSHLFEMYINKISNNFWELRLLLKKYKIQH